jgi:hypothetical protein
MIWNDTKRDAAASFIRRRDGSRISKALKRQSASRCLSFGPHKHNSRRTKSAGQRAFGSLAGAYRGCEQANLFPAAGTLTNPAESTGAGTAASEFDWTSAAKDALLCASAG